MLDKVTFDFDNGKSIELTDVPATEREIDELFRMGGLLPVIGIDEDTGKYSESIINLSDAFAYTVVFPGGKWRRRHSPLLTYI